MSLGINSKWQTSLLYLSLLLTLCVSPIALAAPKVPRTVETSGLEMISPETDKAILRGLRYLASQQQPDGSFGDSTAVRSNVAIVSLSGMAFLSAGHTPGRGEFGQTVEKATQFILKASQPNGFIHINDSIGHGPMYGHGFATLFLAEVYGMSPRDEIKDKLERAVKTILNAQNKEGGWRYYPVKNDADISVTVCQMMALRAARNAGISVPKETVDSCLQYVKKCQNLDGGFKYQLLQGSESLFPRSAAGLVALYSAGIYEGKNVERALGYVQRFHPTRAIGAHRNEPHFFYGHYYAVQGMWLAGGDAWQQWYPAIQKELVAQQMSDGSWGDHFSAEYGTAMACIILQMPNCYLPIFQR